jgi:hypothetical protein
MNFNRIKAIFACLTCTMAVLNTLAVVYIKPVETHWILSAIMYSVVTTFLLIKIED